MTYSVKVGLLVVTVAVAVGIGFLVVATSNTRTTTSPSNTPATSSTKTVDTTVTNASNAAGKAGGTVSITPNTSSTPTPTANTTAKTTTITYTGKTFSPVSVTIVVGDSVSFMNSSSTSVNIGSDPYPTNTDYLPLNLGLLAPGNTSSKIAFTKAGTYGYHNHLDATQTGTIIVK